MSASEQTSASKREPGYYWVRPEKGDDFELAKWTGEQWLLFDYLLAWKEGTLFEVNENRPQSLPQDTFDPHLVCAPKKTRDLQKLKDKLEAGQPDELSKAAEDVQLLKQQRIHDMNRISDLETTLKAHPDKLSTYFDLVQARRELSKAQARIKELEFELRRLIYGYRVSGFEALKSNEWAYIYDKAEAKLNGEPKP